MKNEKSVGIKKTFLKIGEGGGHKKYQKQITLMYYLLKSCRNVKTFRLMNPIFRVPEGSQPGSLEVNRTPFLAQR